ncbi:integral membrane protein-like protein [Xylogone sp. PMI_703]|nr:integral membrane protein-like protein [Xylogone sp. PMI_703]
MVRSILSRKRDLAYLIYFVIHLPIMFLVDLQGLYPPSIVPKFMTNITDFHKNTYKDQFFVSPPPFFKLFMWLELLYHVPMCLWSYSGLVNDSPKTPILLLIYAVQTFVTTATCIADYVTWDLTFDEKMNLTTLYGPYLALSLFMGVDMYFRLVSLVSKGAIQEKAKKN